MGPLIPLFRTFGDICPGFQSKDGSLACFLACVILKFTSGVTPADCIEVSMAAEAFWSMYLQACPQALVEGSGLEPTTVHAAHSKHGHCKPFGHSTSARKKQFIPKGMESNQMNATIEFWRLSLCQSTSVDSITIKYNGQWTCWKRLELRHPRGTSLNLLSSFTGQGSHQI